MQPSITPTPTKCDSRTLPTLRTAQIPKKLPCTAAAVPPTKEIQTPPTAAAVQGSSGGRGRFGGRRPPSERGVFPLQGLPPPPPHFHPNKNHTPRQKTSLRGVDVSARFHPMLSLILFGCQRRVVPCRRVSKPLSNGFFSVNTATRQNISLPAEARLQAFFFPPTAAFLRPRL